MTRAAAIDRAHEHFDSGAFLIDLRRRVAIPSSSQEPERAAVLRCAGGSLPNDCFSDVLGLPTIWVPHFYAGCSPHAPDEHLLAPIAREGLGMMAGLFWDLGEPGVPRVELP